MELTTFDWGKCVTLRTDSRYFRSGFANIRAYPPQSYPGFIILRLGSQEKPHVLSVAARLIESLRERELHSELWIVEEMSIRVRAGWLA